VQPTTNNNATVLFLHLAVACALSHDTLISLPCFTHPLHSHTLDLPRTHRYASRFVSINTNTNPTASQSTCRTALVFISTYYSRTVLHCPTRAEANPPRNLQDQDGRLPGYAVQERRCQDPERRDPPGSARHDRRVHEHEVASLVSSPCDS
jgi:hypothetical protein